VRPVYEHPERDCSCAGSRIDVISTVRGKMDDNIPYALKKRMLSVKNYFIKMATKNIIKVARNLKEKIALKVTDKITFFERIAHGMDKGPENSNEHRVLRHHFIQKIVTLVRGKRRV